MSEGQATAYLSIGKTVLRSSGPLPKRHGRRVLYDRIDLDRWADRLGEQLLDEKQRMDESAEVERRFLEKFRGQN